MRRHRLLLSALAGVALLVGVLYVTVGRYLLARGTTTPVPLEEVERRYYASTTSTPPSTPPSTTAGDATGLPTTDPATSPPVATVGSADAVLPAPGVYVYATQGADHIDALGGDHHDYPATTTITITASDCGVVQRWDVLKERWESWQRCADGSGTSVSESARTNYDEFFSNGVLDAYTCSGDARPVAGAPGQPWVTTCTDSDGSAETHSGVVVGTEERSVGPQSVATLHVTVTVTDDDPSNLQTIDTWYLAGSDLVVAQTSTDHAVNPSPIGNVNYDEQYSIELTSLSPVT